jgi:hypothetical protein
MFLPTPSPSLKGGEQNLAEFFDAFGAEKLQKKDFPALEGGAPKAGWVKGPCPPLNPKGRGERDYWSFWSTKCSKNSRPLPILSDLERRTA